MPLARSGAHSVRFVEGESLGGETAWFVNGCSSLPIDTFGRFAALCQRSHRHDHGHDNGSPGAVVPKARVIVRNEVTNATRDASGDVN